MFVESLVKAIEDSKVAAFFDEDILVGTSTGTEMSPPTDADQAIVVLSRFYLTQERPMEELSIFLKKGKMKICPLYYKVTPDELWDIVAVYDNR